jgi:uncharacterized protein (DUF1778 family)
VPNSDSKARSTIADPRLLILSPRDSRAFVDALIRPKTTNARLRETVRRYRKNANSAPGDQTTE